MRLFAVSLLVVLAVGCGSSSSGGGGGGDGGTPPPSGLGAPTELASLGGFNAGGAPEWLVLDDTSVYFTVFQQGPPLQKVPKAGGATTALAQGGSNGDGLVVDATGVYWHDQGKLERTALDGSMTADVASIGTGGITSLVADDANVYFAMSVIGSQSALSVVAKSGGTPRMLAMNLDRPIGLAVDATRVYVADLGPGSTGGAPGAILAVDKSTGASTTIASNQSARAVAVDATSVYWTTEGTPSGSGGTVTESTGTVMKAPLAGGAPTMLASAQDSPWGIAIDDGYVYWAVRGQGTEDGAIRRVAKGGGEITSVAEQQGEPRFVAVDATGVYWTCFKSGKVMKAAK